MIEMQFSAEVIKALPNYLGTTWNCLIKESNFKYSKMYIYNVGKGKQLLSPQLNTELNRLWSNLALDYSDLTNIYSLVSTVEMGNAKYKKYIGGK